MLYLMTLRRHVVLNTGTHFKSIFFCSVDDVKRLLAVCAVEMDEINEIDEFEHTLLMYLHPQTVLHPHTSVSYFHSQVFAGFNGGVFKVGGSDSVKSGKFSCVMPGIVFSGGGESMCGDNERIRGKSISNIFSNSFAASGAEYFDNLRKFSSNIKFEMK